MASQEIIKKEISNYLILADELKALYQDIDDETLLDTLEGISQLPDLIQALEELTRAGNAVADLAEFLERNPNALLTGKKRPKGQP